MSTNCKIINGHVFQSFYVGVVEYWIDGKTCWDVETAAKYLGISVEEFMEVA